MTLTAESAGVTLQSGPPNEPRSAYAKIEIPVGLSVEALMMTTTRHRAISDLRHAKAASRLERRRPVRQSRPRSGGIIPTKDFGFVQLAGGGDAFLHVSVVERSGNSTMPPGVTLEVRTAPGQKGVQITEILSVDTSIALVEPPRRARPEPRHAPSDQVAIENAGKRFLCWISSSPRRTANDGPSPRSKGRPWPRSTSSRLIPAIAIVLTMTCPSGVQNELGPVDAISLLRMSSIEDRRFPLQRVRMGCIISTWSGQCSREAGHGHIEPRGRSTYPGTA